MKHYQPKKNNPYRLPHNVYMQCLYAIRDYERIRGEREEILYSSPSPDGQPRGSDTSDTTANKAVRLAELSRQCEDVEQALVRVPAEYRRGVMDNILYRCGYPNDAGEATYWRWRYRFVYYVARKKGLV